MRALVSTVPSLLPHPTDATLTVTRAADVLGVHPNTIRAWSDAGRLRYYRINPRGDRRYRLGDLQRFLANAAEGPAAEPEPRAGGRIRRGRHREVASPDGAAPFGGRAGPGSLIERARPRPSSNRSNLDVLARIGP